MLTFEQIKELIELIAQRRLQGLELERSGFRLKIDGQAVAQSVFYAAPAAEAAQPLPASQAPAAHPPAPVSAPAAAAAPSAAAPAAATEKAGPPANAHILTSPIVGTYYRSPSPDAPPFIEVGSRVKKGQVLCIIEAMKLMNEIDSEYDGEIANVYVESGQPVQYGERLFAIRTR